MSRVASAILGIGMKMRTLPHEVPAFSNEPFFLQDG